jgi:hypothetical protein
MNAGGVAHVIDTGYGGEINDTNWHHIAVCKVGSKYGVYKDGAQVNYTDNNATDTFSGNLVIGQGGDNNLWVDGYVDEIRMQHWNYFNASPNSAKTDTIAVPVE